MTESRQDPVIRVHGLSFSYEGRHRVLENVSFAIEPLDFASVIGPNGGGKTTLVKLILGLLEPSTGSVEVLGTTPARARPRIGYLPQYASLDPSFPVRVADVVLMGRLGPGRRLGRYSRQDCEAADQALERVGLAGLGKRAFSALSGGQRQRVLLARALVCQPELLLLDEPAAGLDRAAEQQFVGLLEEFNETGTVVLVSHDLGFVASVVRTVICVRRTVELHPTSELDGSMIADLYGGDVRLVHHGHSL